MRDRVYLAGAIEHTLDGGVTWRKDITPDLLVAGFDVLNPCITTDGIVAKILGWDHFSFDKWKAIKNNDPKKYKEATREVVSADIQAVQSCEHILVYFDEYAETSTGTHGEMTLARACNKNIVVLKIGAVYISPWLEGCATCICTTKKEAIKKMLENKSY